MGIGDDLLFLGEAEALYKKTGKKIVPVYGNGWSPLFKNVEFLSKEKKNNCITLNARDTDSPSDYHVDYYTRKKVKTMFGDQLIFRPYTPKPFHIRFTDEELAAADKILLDYGITEFCAINPDFKKSFFGNNKNWGFDKYQSLTDRLANKLQVVRIKPGGDYKEKDLINAINISSEDIRISFAILRKAKFGISYDGFFIHAMSGMNIPCVAILGGFSSSNMIHYEGNIEIEYSHPESPCGRTFDCDHCREANKAITVDQVEEACDKLYYKRF